jgi:hypothetical protein
MMTGRFDQFKDEEIVLRSVIIQRGPRPPLPSTDPPNSSNKLMISSTSSSSSLDDDINNTSLKFGAFK